MRSVYKCLGVSESATLNQTQFPPFALPSRVLKMFWQRSMCLTVFIVALILIPDARGVDSASECEREGANCRQTRRRVESCTCKHRRSRGSYSGQSLRRLVLPRRILLYVARPCHRRLYKRTINICVRNVGLEALPLRGLVADTPFRSAVSPASQQIPVRWICINA